MNREEREGDIVKNSKCSIRECFTAALLKINFRPDYSQNRHLSYQALVIVFVCVFLIFLIGLSRECCPLSLQRV